MNYATKALREGREVLVRRRQERIEDRDYFANRHRQACESVDEHDAALADVDAALRVLDEQEDTCASDSH